MTIDSTCPSAISLHSCHVPPHSWRFAPPAPPTSPTVVAGIIKWRKNLIWVFTFTLIGSTTYCSKKHVLLNLFGTVWSLSVSNLVEESHNIPEDAGRRHFRRRPSWLRVLPLREAVLALCSWSFWSRRGIDMKALLNMVSWFSQGRMPNVSRREALLLVGHY